MLAVVASGVGGLDIFIGVGPSCGNWNDMVYIEIFRIVMAVLQMEWSFWVDSVATYPTCPIVPLCHDDAVNCTPISYALAPFVAANLEAWDAMAPPVGVNPSVLWRTGVSAHAVGASSMTAAHPVAPQHVLAMGNGF